MNYKRLITLLGVTALSAAALTGCSSSKGDSSQNQNYSSARPDVYADLDYEEYDYEEETEEYTEKKMTYAASEEILNADILSGSFQFMDTVYTLGKSTGDDVLAFQDKQDVYNFYDGDLSISTLLPESDILDFYHDDDLTHLNFGLKSTDKYPVKISNTVLSYGSYIGYYEGSPAGLAFLPGGIEVGVSSYDDVVAVYGEPGSELERISGEHYRNYYKIDNRTFYFYFDLGKDVLSGFTIS